ncbi:MAG: TonB-dependent receptor [Bacteroidetes bacterium]|nr:TonB-dependent receptor [Bacteroidota bacterium]MBU1485640.1 TonB-dependent receptor [Bacteroidota bacterium]MBU2046471.1 TonB-dependent receptor [Bacteroidota bacterium]MBU2268307.1 TonB-dependent receptor [Bacteroidota bacterium]MBU2376953.1 TonB-dependent receptor [Bacteroidota bacterium]
MLTRFKKLVWLVLLLPTLAFAQKTTISGYIKDANTKEALIGAAIQIPKLKIGATSNQYGYYSLTFPTADTTAILISYNGYQPVAKQIVNKKSLQVDILLQQANSTLNEVVVNANRNEDNVKKAQMGVIDIPIRAIKELPVLLGEHDILKTIQLLPGVQGGQEGTTGFYVRGGNLDQNLIQLDEATVYNPSHLFGLFSTFNVNAINSVKLIKGGFPSQYGGRLSSILDIKMKEGNKTKFVTEGGLGLISGNLTFQGPIQKNKSSFIISARRSYIDLFLKQISKTTTYRFYDINAKVNYELGKNDHLFISVFKGNDDAAYTGANSLNYGTNFGNSTASLRWNHLYGNKIFSNTSLIYNDYHLQLGTAQNSYYQVLYTGIKDINAKTDFTATPSTKHTIKFGANYTYHTLYPGAISAKIPKKGNKVAINPDSLTKRYSSEAAFYVNDDYQLSENLSVNYGVRIPVFNASGKTYTNIEPRITTRLSLNKSTSLKASYTQMNQFVHLVPSSTASLPADIWLTSSNKIKPQTSNQVALGLFKNFKDNEIETSLEVYYKTMNNQVLFKEGTQILLNTNLDNVLTFGKGKSYGVELFIKKNFGRLTGWASYTLSKSTQQFPDLNFGNSFPSSYDRTNNLSLAASYELTKTWTLSADLVYYTGKPYTLPAGKVLVYGDGSLYDNYYYDYTNRNNSRLKAYNRLDISFSNKKQAKLFKKFPYEREWVFGFYNVYSRANPYFVYLGVDPATKQPQAKQVSLLPIIPSVSFNFKF